MTSNCIHTSSTTGSLGCGVCLAASFAALPPGGVTIDYEAHIDADNTGSCPRWCSISLFLMHSTRGKCWSVGELEAMLLEVGDVTTAVTADDRSTVWRGVSAARPPV